MSIRRCVSIDAGKEIEPFLLKKKDLKSLHSYKFHIALNKCKRKSLSSQSTSIRDMDDTAYAKVSQNDHTYQCTSPKASIMGNEIAKLISMYNESRLLVALRSTACYV